MTYQSQLSETTCDYLCTLLRQVADYESLKALRFKAELAAKNCIELNQYLQQQYPEPAVVASVIQQLNNLTYMHKTLSNEVKGHPEYGAQLLQIKQQILQLLGANTTT